MKNGYEYYYLFGLDIPLHKYGLGCIKQPRIIDYIKKDIDISSFHLPFVINEVVIKQSESKEEILKLKEHIGSFNFFIMSCSNNISIFQSLIDDLKVIYNTENVRASDSLSCIFVDDFKIDNSNFDILSDIVLEMIKVDKSKLKSDKLNKRELSELEKEFERRRREHEERVNGNKKDKSISLLDIANIVSHSGIYKYDDVLNMTIYQMKNTFEVLNSKETFDINTLYRVSPKFDMSKEKYEHWTERIKLDKSTLSQDNG